MTGERFNLSRREVLKTVGAGALLGGSLGRAAGQDGEPKLPAGGRRVGPGPTKVELTLNGKPTALTVEPRVTLLDALRDRLGLTGTKRICDRGACGGCTVHLNGELVNACMMLAVDAAGAQVTTIEGLSQGDDLHPVQQAFVDKDALMCGFCTPGMVMSCAKVCEPALKGEGKPTLEDIRRGLSGNLCRCGTYPHIFEAAQEVCGG